MEKRDTKFTRLRSGKIDSRLIASLGFNNEAVFNRIESFEYDPAMIYMSIDGSSSMGGNAFRKTIIVIC